MEIFTKLNLTPYLRRPGVSEIAFILDDIHEIGTDSPFNESEEKIKTALGWTKSFDYIRRSIRWCLIFRTLQRSISLAIKDSSFVNYPRQDPWYVFAREHGQIRGLVACVTESPFIIQNQIPLKNTDIYLPELLEPLLAAGSFDEPLEKLIEASSYIPELEDMVLCIDELEEQNFFSSIEKEICINFVEHFKNLKKDDSKIGLISIEWDPEGGECYGMLYNYNFKS